MASVDEILRQIAFVEKPKSLYCSTIFKQPVENEWLKDHARRVIVEIAKSANISVSLALDDSESGFASYTEAFCFRSTGSEGRGPVRDLPRGETQGLGVCLSYCAPYAAVCRASATVSGTFVGFSGSPVDLDSTLVSARDDHWVDVLTEIVPKVERGGFHLLWKDDLAVEIPDGIHVETVNNAGPKFRAFDLLFSWMD